jgi:hypothetical protein
MTCLKIFLSVLAFLSFVQSKVSTDTNNSTTFYCGVGLPEERMAAEQERTVSYFLSVRKAIISDTVIWPKHVVTIPTNSH